ncbi:MAG TPA: rod shape-determining protein, partial [Actinomycetota bacterium]|nr:rod shape-determining protein [Actinomycetota bacterium]
MAGRDIALDLGTANTLVYRQGEGIVFNEPTVVAMNAATGTIEAMGDEAWQMIGGRSGNVIAVRPLRHGVMTEFDITQRMIEVVLQRVGVSRFHKPRVVACISSESSEVERRAVEEAVKFAGGKGVVLVEEPLAAAIGARLPIHEPIGNLVVDIGGGTTEMAVVSMGGVVSGVSIRTGGFDLDAAIAEHIRAEYGVAVGEKAAEEIKVAIGSAFPVPQGKVAVVVGRELTSGAPSEIRVREDEIRQAMSEPVRRIVDGARRTLAEAPPELTHDVLEAGMFLTGGGGLLRGLDLLLSQECEVPVHLTDRPLETVVLG